MTKKKKVTEFWLIYYYQSARAGILFDCQFFGSYKKPVNISSIVIMDRVILSLLPVAHI